MDTNLKSSVKNSASRLESLFSNPSFHVLNTSETETISITPDQQDGGALLQ